MASLGRENVHVMVVVSSMEAEWSCYKGGHFNGGRMVMEVTILNEVEWLCYRGSLFNGGRMVVTKVASLKEGERLLQKWQV